jgi:hypothetical protein
MSGNILSYLVLFSWPLVCLAVFAARKGTARLPTTVAWMLLLPIMFLPSNMAWDPPLLPPFNKFRISTLTIFLALKIFHGNDTLKKAPGHRIPGFLFTLYLLGMIGTINTNPDTFVFGPLVLPGLTWYDLLSAAIQESLDIFLPFYIGQRVFRDRDALIEFFKVMTTCALIYAPLMLFEVRFSPQLHMWIYGYYPSEFQQAMRGTGFRPIVFMNHGLSVAGWMYACLVSSLALRRAGVTFPNVKTTARIYINWVLLFLAKSFGPIIYGSIATILRLASVKWIARFVVVASLLVAVYPVLRAQDVFPTADLVNMFRSISGDRADSLKFRFDNEDLLLRHAMERPMFGWGTFGRNQIYSETGKLETVTDGQWIIVLGTFGYVGHVIYFTLLLLPLMRFLRSYRKMPAREQGLCAMLALLLATFVLDLLPNAFSDYLTLVYGGMLWTLSEVFRRKRPKANKGAGKRPLSEREFSVSEPPAEPGPDGPLVTVRG